jgi:hypothetical protein
MKNINKKICWILIAPLALSVCASAGAQREQALLNQYSDSKKDKYHELLVSRERYTSGGISYHEKFLKYLIAIATDVVENKKITIEKGTIGFYFDKRSSDANKFFLGIDVNSGKTSARTYGLAAVRLFRKSLRDLIDTVNSCRSIFYEDEIAGMVIGWKWERDGASESATIWISKEDLTVFNEHRITVDELIQRSTITNAEKRIILLPL